jgi:hypothetical protein
MSRVASAPSAELSWLEPFDSLQVFREQIDQSFVMARAAVSLLPQTSEAWQHDSGLESLAIAEWLKLETQALEALDLSLSLLNHNVLTLCDELERVVKGVGTLNWIRERSLKEEAHVYHLETDLLQSEWESEHLGQLQLQHQLCSFVANRYSTYLLQILSPFRFEDTDDTHMKLVFPTPIDGLDIFMQLNNEDGSLRIDYDEEVNRGVETGERREITRLPPSHACATFYRAFLRASIGSLIQPDPEDATKTLLHFGLLLIRLEKACWDLHHLSSLHLTNVIDWSEDDESAVEVIANVSPDVSFRTIYRLADARTLALGLPTSYHLEVSRVGKTAGKAYPKQPLVQVVKSLLHELPVASTGLDSP